MPRGIAVYDLFARCRRPAHALRVGVEGYHIDVLLLQHVRQALARAAITADDDVPLGREALRGDAMQGKRLQHPFRARPAQRELVACLNEEGSGEHRQQHRRDDELRKVALEQRNGLRLHDEHQAELAGLGESKTGAQGRAGSGSQQAREHGDQHELERDQQRRQRQRQRKIGCYRPEIESHAYGHEEQAQQDLPKRPDVLVDLMPVLGFGDQHTGEKSAQGKRQPSPLREPCKPQCDEQHVEDEQFMRAAARHNVKPAARQPLSDKQQHHEHHGGLEQCEPQTLGKLSASLRDRRNHDQQRHDRQILEQQHADDVASVRGFQLHTFREKPQDDCGRRHGQCAPDRKGGLPWRAREYGGGEHRCEREQDLGQPEPEHRATQLKKLSQAELEPDREHQEHDAEFREMPSFVGVRNPRQRERSHRDPDQQISEQRRQM